MELHFLTIAEMSRLIASRELSPVELVMALLRRVEALDSQVNAFITVTAERAIEQARRAEAEIGAGRWRGPLHGIPFGLKDIYNTRGILTSGHSRVSMDNIPASDATAVAKLYESGAILLGKLASHEFAHGGPSFDLPWPPARNPWYPAHYSGGSSSGSGVAVAAGLVPLALGSDTGGSIRTPALLCGTIGLKPTYGLISRYGVMQNSATFDYCGPLTWTVEDCAIALQVLAGHDANDLTSSRRPLPDYRAALTGDIRGIRIGVLRHFWEKDLPANDELRAAMDAAIDVFRGLGAQIEDTRMRPLQDYYDVKLVIAESEIFSVYQHELAGRPGDFGADFLWKILPACLFQATDYMHAQRERRRMIAAMRPLYERYDVLLTGGAGPAPRLDAYRPLAFWQKPINMATPFNVTGGPALALCNGFSANGLPLGMQIVGRPFDEPTVFRVADAYERATHWRNRRPQLVPGAPLVPVDPKPEFDGVAAVNEHTRQLVERLSMRAGLNLTEVQLARLGAAAPYALEMAARIPGDHTWWEGPSNVFRARRSSVRNSATARP